MAEKKELLIVRRKYLKYIYYDRYHASVLEVEMLMQRLWEYSTLLQAIPGIQKWC